MKGLVYRFVRGIIFLLAKIIFRLRIVGHSNIPNEGRVIIAANHASYLDPPLVGCSIVRRVNFMAMAELFRNPFCRAMYRVLGGFPVKRREADAGAIRHAVRLLKDGKVVMIFPEGTRSYDGRLQEPRGGVGMIVALSRAKVVPAFIKGTEKALPRDSWRLKAIPVTIYFGRPLDFADELKGLDDKKVLSDKRKMLYNIINMKIMDEIAKLQGRAISEGIEKQ